MCFGTFDIFHDGHKHYLDTAKKLAPKMIIVISRDHRVLAIKWKPALHDEASRLTEVQKHYPDALVILWDDADIYVPIRQYEPDILTFWYDQYVPEKYIAKIFPNIEIVRIDSYEPHIYKSSLLRKKYD